MRTECPLCGSPARGSQTCPACGLVFRLEATTATAASTVTPSDGPAPAASAEGGVAAVATTVPSVPAPPAPPAPHLWAASQRPGPDRGSRGPATKPSSYLGWAVATVLLCCPPFGIVAVVHAARVDTLWQCGDRRGALAASRRARAWALASMLTSVVVLVAYVVVVMRIGVRSPPRRS